MAFGLGRMLGRRRDDGRAGGLGFFLLGVWLLLNELDILDYRDSWPLLLIAMGISLVWKSLARVPAPRPTPEN